MKNFIKILMVLTIFTIGQVNAAVYICRSEAGTDYLLALGEGKGMLFTNKHGYFAAIKGDVQVNRALDDGPTFASYQPARPSINWRLENSCWTFGPDSLRFKVRVSSFGDSGSTVQALSNYYIDPAQPHCSVPRILRVRPAQKINCKLVK